MHKDAEAIGCALSSAEKHAIQRLKGLTFQNVIHRIRVV